MTEMLYFSVEQHSCGLTQVTFDVEAHFLCARNESLQIILISSDVFRKWFEHLKRCT